MSIILDKIQRVRRIGEELREKKGGRKWSGSGRGREDEREKEISILMPNITANIVITYKDVL